jgi:hypothetical protein
MIELIVSGAELVHLEAGATSPVFRIGRKWPRDFGKGPPAGPGRCPITAPSAAAREQVVCLRDAREEDGPAGEHQDNPRLSFHTTSATKTLG